MAEVTTDATEPGYTVYRLMGRAWLPISAAFASEAAARRYRESLPLDWETEIREVASG